MSDDKKTSTKKKPAIDKARENGAAPEMEKETQKGKQKIAPGFEDQYPKGLVALKDRYCAKLRARQGLQKEEADIRKELIAEMEKHDIRQMDADVDGKIIRLENKGSRVRILDADSDE